MSATETGRKWVHRLSNIRPEVRLADCAGCGVDVPLRYRPGRSSWLCENGYKASQRRPRNRVRRGTPRSNRLYALRSKYGIDADFYDQLLASQGHVCAICLNPETVSGRALAVDHDHTSGLVRGLLCGACNRALGLMRDDPAALARAAQYLRTAS